MYGVFNTKGFVSCDEYTFLWKKCSTSFSSFVRNLFFCLIKTDLSLLKCFGILETSMCIEKTGNTLNNATSLANMFPSKSACKMIASTARLWLLGCSGLSNTWPATTEIVQGWIWTPALCIAIIERIENMLALKFWETKFWIRSDRFDLLVKHAMTSREYPFRSNYVTAAKMPIRPAPSQRDLCIILIKRYAESGFWTSFFLDYVHEDIIKLSSRI